MKKAIAGSCRTALLALCTFVASSVVASPSATLDGSFAIGSGAGLPDPGAGNWGQVQALAVQPDGKVIAGGQSYFDDFNGTAVPALCRINTDGSLDTAFLSALGTGPYTGTTIGEINAITLQPDGKILIGGDFISVNGTSRVGIARLNANGSLDTGFLSGGGGVGGQVLRYVSTISLQSDGKILIAGGFANYLGTARAGVARLNTDGTLDTSFAPAATGLLGANVIAQQADGKIYVGGGFTNWAGFAAPGIVRLFSNGALDTTFVPTHFHPSPGVNALCVLGDGRILIGGFIEGTTNTTTRYLARLNADGSLDTGYAGNPDGWLADIIPWPEGGHLIMGRYRNVGGQVRGELALLDDNGNVDLGFAPPAIPNPLQDLIHIYTGGVAPDGKIVVGGWFTNYPNNTQLNGQDYSGIARLIGGYTGGPGKFQFTTSAVQVNEDVGTVTIEVRRIGGLTGAATVDYATAAGTASLADFGAVSGTLNFPDGVSVRTITINITNDVAAEGLESFTVNLSNPTGGVTLGSKTSTTVNIVDDDSAPSITKQPQSTTVYLTFNATFSVSAGPGLPVAYQWLSNSVPIVGATNFSLNLTGVQTNYAATYSVIVSNAIGAITSSGATLTVAVPAGLPEPTFVTTGGGFNNAVYDLLFQSNGIVGVGDFAQYGGTAIPNRVARINLDGTRDTNFPAAPAGANGIVYQLGTFPDGKLIIGGALSTYANTNRSKFAKLLANGALDLTFSNAALTFSFSAQSILTQTNGGIYFGNTTGVTRFNAGGTNDTNFVSPAMSGQVYALAEQADGRILAAPYRTAGSSSEIIRMSTNGTRDITFAVSATGFVQRLDVLPDGRILVGGVFTALICNGVTNSITNFAVLNPNGSLDTSCNVGTGPNAAVVDSVVQKDGRILLCGDFTLWNGAPAGRYIRLLPNGTVDPTFVVGAGANAYVRAISMDPAGRVAIGGSFTSLNGQARGSIALLTSDAGAIQFTSPTSIVNEQSGTITVSVERVAGSRGAVSLDFVTSDGTATAGSDYTATNGTLSWADGEYGVKTFDIAINNDASIEPDETINVNISKPGTVFGLYTNLTITILDNESTPRISSQPANIVSPEDVSATFSVAGFSALPITYQWRSNNVNILNATNATLTLLNVQSNFAATYSVRVNNSNGSTDSSNAVLTVIPSPTRRDANFNVNPAINGNVRAILPLGDGRAMIGGDFTAPRNKIMLLNSAGVVDATFTNTAGGTGTVSIYDIERDNQGRWLIGGQFGQFGGMTISNLVRLNADYSVDTNFLSALGASPNAVVYDVAVGPDGKIWVAGNFSLIGGPYGLQKLARLNDNGSIDFSFTPRAGINSPVRKVLPLASGGALICGDFSSYASGSGYYTRILPDGRGDNTYNPGLGPVSDFTMLPDGSVIAVGSFTSPTAKIAKLKPNGSQDVTFLEGLTANSSMNTVAVQSNGRILVGGAFTTIGVHSNRFTRIEPTGVQDTSINVGAGFSSDILKIAVDHTGPIWIGGQFTTYKGLSAPYLIRLNGDDPTVTIGQQPMDAVVAPGQNVSFTVTAAGVAPLGYQWFKNGAPLGNGGAIAGANTTTLNLTGVSLGDAGSYSIVVSNAVGATVTSRAAVLQVKAAPNILSQPVGGIIPVGGRLSLLVQADGAPTLSYQWFKDNSPVGGNAPIYVVTNCAIANSGSYYVVVSNTLGTATSATTVVNVQVTPATAVTDFFNDAGPQNLSDTVYAALPLPDGRLLIGGQFTAVKTNGANQTFRQYVALFKTNGTADTFNPSPNTSVSDIVRQPDGKIIIVGSFTSINTGTSNLSRAYIARFNADLTVDYGFHQSLGVGPDSSINDVAVQPDGKLLIAGGFNAVSSKPNTRSIARLNADGSVDDSFVSGATFGFSGGNVDVLPDGRIYYLGSSSYGGVSGNLFRLTSSGLVDTTFTNSLSGITSIAHKPTAASSSVAHSPLFTARTDPCSLAC